MDRLCLFLIPILILTTSVAAEFRVQRQVFNDVDVMVVFDTDDPTGDVLQFAYVAPNVTVGRAYLVRASSETPPVARQVVARTLASVAVITQPSGCDGPDAARAVENSNCVAAGVDTETQRQLLLRTWALPWYGDRSACVAAGGNKQTCLGKPLLVMDGTDALRLKREFTQTDLLFARTIFLEDFAGPHAEIPAVVEIDVERPLLRLETTCALFGDSFAGTYRLLATDAYMGFLTEVHTAFQRWDSNGALAEMRVLLERDNATVVTDVDRIRIVLADAAGTGVQFDFYRRWFFSDYFDVRSSVHETIQDRFGRALNLSSAFNSTSNSTTNCSLIMSLQPAPTPLRLLTPETVTILNYWDNFPQRFYVKRPGNYHIGARDRNGMLRFAYTPEFNRGGGIALFESQEFPYARFDVHPDINWADYTLDCVGAYPRAPTFTGFGLTGSDGATYAREYDAGDLCRAPILNPDKVLSDSSPRARELDCAKQGMILASNLDFCWRPRADARVPRHFLPWNEYGHLRLDEKKHSFMRVTPDEFQQACDAYDPRRFGAGVLVPLRASDADYELFIQDRFLFFEPNARDTPYVVCNAANALCTAYWDADDDGRIRVEPWARTSAAWPICRLHFSQFEAPGRFQSWPTETVRLMRDGQATGKPHDGMLTLIRSLLGYGFSGRVPTCPRMPDRGVFDNTLNDTQRAEITGMQRWFMTCMMGERGLCRDNRPRTCQCRPWFGPPGVYVSAFETNKVTQPDCPCCCPATSERGGYVRINGVTTFTGDWLVCGGHERGECVASADAGTGVCRCERGIVTSVLATSITEPAWAGNACQCPVPRLSLRSAGQDYPSPRREACSGRGSCCPFTDRHIARTSTKTAQTGVGAGGVALEECFDDDGNARTGCDCSSTPGWTGDACACRGRTNLAYGRAVLAGTAVPSAALRNNTAVVLFPSPLLVRSVSVRAQRTDIDGIKNCTVLGVGVASTLDAAPTACALDERNEWRCDATVFSLAVVVRTAETTPQCRVEAWDFESSFLACGGPGHGNPFAQRFWASETTRGANTFAELNLARQSLSSAGCAHRYECMCHTNYVGAGCLAGTSRLDLGLQGETVLWPCGSTRNPPTGKLVFDQRTALARCECASFNYVDPLGKFIGAGSQTQFTGDACEAAVWLNPVLGTQPQTCGGFTHVRPHFRLGWCSFDLDDYAADPLWTPAIRVRAETLRATEVTLNESVAIIEGNFWMLPRGTIVSWPTIVGNVRACGAFPVGVDATILSAGLLDERPRVVRPNVTVWNCSVAYPTFLTPVRTCDVVATVWTNASEFRWCGPEFATNNRTCVLAVNRWDDVAAAANASFSFPFNTPTSLAFVCANGTNEAYDVAALYESTVLGALDCNNAVHRMADAFLGEIRGNQYQLRCPYAVTLYNNVLGSFFGLMWDQIPDLKFPDDCAAQCTAQHLRLLSSLFNDRMCFGADALPLEMDDRALAAYGRSLVNRTFTSLVGDNGTAEAARIIEIVFTQTDFQNFTLSFFRNSEVAIAAIILGNALVYDGIYTPFNPRVPPAPATELAYAGPAIHDETFVHQMFSLETVLYGWYFLSFGPPYDMAFLRSTVTNDTVLLQHIVDSVAGNYSLSNTILRTTRHPRYVLPGLWQTLVGDIRPEAFTLRFGRDADLVEVYDGHYRLCATLSGVRAGTNATLSCASHQWTFNESALVAHVNRALDVARAYFDAHADDIGSTLRDDVFAYLPVSFKMLVLGMLNDVEAFMKIRVVDSLATYADGVPDPNEMSTYHYQYRVMDTNTYAAPVDFSRIVSSDVANGTTYAQTWDALTDAIVVQKTWPFNGVWDAFVSQRATSCRAMNVSDARDRTFLVDFWNAVVAPRRCSRTAQCSDFNRAATEAECVFPTGHVPWRNGGTDDATTGLAFGDEGGCACTSSAPALSAGFFDAAFFCQRCAAGWGPETPEQWAQAVRYRESYANLTGVDDFPLAQNLSQPTLCAFPYVNDRVCGGSGAVRRAQTAETVSMVVQPDPHDAADLKSPACARLVVSPFGVSAEFAEFAFEAQTTNDVFATQWVFANATNVSVPLMRANATQTTLSQIDGQMFVVGAESESATALVLGSCASTLPRADSVAVWECVGSNAVTGDLELVVRCDSAWMDANAAVTFAQASRPVQLTFEPGVFWSTVVVQGQGQEQR